jgi:hypothetical protein
MEQVLQGSKGEMQSVAQDALNLGCRITGQLPLYEQHSSQARPIAHCNTFLVS